MKKERIFKYVILGLTIIVNLFIIINGFVDGVNSAKESGAVAKVIEDVVNDWSPGTVSDSNRAAFKLFTRKFVGHFCLCGLSGILTTLTYYLFLKDSKLKFFIWFIVFSLATGFVISLTSELAQLVAPERVYSMKDVGIDFTGYSLGVIMTFIVLLIVQLSVRKIEGKKEAN